MCCMRLAANTGRENTPVLFLSLRRVALCCAICAAGRVHDVAFNLRAVWIIRCWKYTRWSMKCGHGILVFEKKRFSCCNSDRILHVYYLVESSITPQMCTHPTWWKRFANDGVVRGSKWTATSVDGVTTLFSAKNIARPRDTTGWTSDMRSRVKPWFHVKLNYFKELFHTRVAAIGHHAKAVFLKFHFRRGSTLK